MHLAARSRPDTLGRAPPDPRAAIGEGREGEGREKGGEGKGKELPPLYLTSGYGPGLAQKIHSGLNAI